MATFAGEAVYVDDIPSPPNCLHGAFIYSTEPFARVKGMGFKTNNEPTKVAAVISYKDIPEEGENVGSKGFLGFEPLFADELTRCAGEPIAFVVIPYFQIFFCLLQILLIHDAYQFFSYIHLKMELNFQVAETQKLADSTANSALVNYETENLDPPILTVEEAVKKSSVFAVPPFFYPKQVGDFSKGMAEADHKILSAKVVFSIISIVSQHIL